MKIIQSNKFRNHMQVHKEEFIVPYTKILELAEKRSLFDNLERKFEVVVMEFPFITGYCDLIETTKDDEIIYAMRYGRKVYTRFVIGKQHYLINKCVICLNRSAFKNEEYYAVTMFPGGKSVKEPQDKYITTIDQLENSLDFWQNHALVYNSDDIDRNTLTKVCPYRDLVENRVMKKMIC